MFSILLTSFLLVDFLIAYAKLHGCYKALIGGFSHYGTCILATYRCIQNAILFLPPIPSHPFSSYPISFLLIPSHLIPFHRIISHLIPSHRIPSHLITNYPLDSLLHILFPIIYSPLLHPSVFFTSLIPFTPNLRSWGFNGFLPPNDSFEARDSWILRYFR